VYEGYQKKEDNIDKLFELLEIFYYITATTKNIKIMLVALIKRLSY